MRLCMPLWGMTDLNGVCTLCSIRKVADHYDAITLEQVNSMVKKAWSHCIDTLYVAVGKSGPGLKQNEGKADEAEE